MCVRILPLMILSRFFVKQQCTLYFYKFIITLGIIELFYHKKCTLLAKIFFLIKNMVDKSALYSIIFYMTTGKKLLLKENLHDR